jgi:hypothetical protein
MATPEPKTPTLVEMWEEFNLTYEQRPASL